MADIDRYKEPVTFGPYRPPVDPKELVIPKPWEPEMGQVVSLVIPVKIFRDLGSGKMDVCDDNGNCLQVSKKSLTKYLNKEYYMKTIKEAILKIAKNLLKANNTVTTLEIKTELRRDYPYFWSPQSDVSMYMDQFAGDGIFTYVDNGSFRIYSLATPTQVAAQTGPVTKALKSKVTTTGPRRGRPRKVITSSTINRSTAHAYVVADNFDSISIAGVTITRGDIRNQKKSPKGYLSMAKLNKLDGITVNGKTYLVS